MKKKIKFLIILIIAITCVMINYNSVSANPNSSRGFADYSDEDAEKENEKLVENQDEKFDTTKSNNNYLESLKIEGYELTPEFDKQTVDYKIDKHITDSNVTITAKAFDDKAKISGIGNIKIEDNQSEFRIDVTAESGSVRTYKISFKKVDEEKNETDETAEKNETENIIVNDTVEDNENAIVEVYSQKDKTGAEEKNQKLFAIIGIVGIIVAIVIIIKVITSKKRK